MSKYIKEVFLIATEDAVIEVGTSAEIKVKESVEIPLVYDLAVVKRIIGSFNDSIEIKQGLHERNKITIKNAGNVNRYSDSSIRAGGYYEYFDDDGNADSLLSYPDDGLASDCLIKKGDIIAKVEVFYS